MIVSLQGALKTKDEIHDGVARSPFRRKKMKCQVGVPRGKESYVIRGCIRLTATSSGRFNNLFIYGPF